MRGRRFTRRFFRRRRRRPETYTLKECRTCTNLYGDSTCTNPVIDIFELLTMRTPRNSADSTELSTPANKFIIFDGMKFQSEYHHDPQETQGCFGLPPGGPPVATTLAFILTIWEAVMILPLGQGSTAAPAYLPNIARGIFQEGDTADRVLWKRLSHLFVQGVASNPSISLLVNPDSTLRYQGSGPAVVKTRARLDDRHGLYYVRNFVHDIFFGFPPLASCNTVDCDACGLLLGSSCGMIPIVHDFYAKMFYHVR